MDVLVIEDNPIVQSGLARVLTQAGFRVTAVGDAMSALSEVEKHVFDVIICDIQLPLVDGTELYQRLEERHPSMSHRVMFVTAMVGDPSIQAFMDRTGRPVIGKPFEIDELLATVRSIAGQATMLDEPIIGIPSPDRAAARRLPDDFVRMSGSPPERVAALIDRHWRSVAESERRQLAQILAIILEPLARGGPLTGELRDQCENAVMEWAARQ